MRLFWCLVLIFGAGVLRANEIDRLQTKRDVERFVKKVFPSLRKEVLFAGSAMDRDVLANHYFKMDLDGDGSMDLVVNGQYTLVVLDQGGHYTVFYIGRRGADYELFRGLIAIDSTGDPKKLVVRQQKGTYWTDAKPPQFYNDTLVIHFGELMEYNAHSDEGFRFDGIRMLTTRCKGPCPLFEMLIRPNHWARYDALENNKRKGRFACFLPAREYDTLLEIVRYMPVARMDTAFLINRTDAQTALVDIYYNGRARQIGDYGEMGTYGLQRLYELFFRWRNALEWKEDQ